MGLKSGRINEAVEICMELPRLFLFNRVSFLTRLNVKLASRNSRQIPAISRDQFEYERYSSRFTLYAFERKSI